MGTYSIAEIINSAWQAVLYGTTVNCVVFAVLDEGTWQKHERKSFDAIMNMVRNIAPHNSVTCYVKNMKELVEYFTAPAC
jgi:predicted nucleotide-binding protein (sugar kinase/HSP70/actin superfamily)